jgi:hypothetical protein
MSQLSRVTYLETASCKCVLRNSSLADDGFCNIQLVAKFSYVEEICAELCLKTVAAMCEIRYLRECRWV